MFSINSISFQGIDLCSSRDDRILFEGINFSITSGQALILEGKNGSGKTSLLRILCGFREPDLGQVLWCGQPINNTDYLGNAAYVGHLDGIKKELTVIGNLKMSLALASAGSCTIDQALNQVQLPGYHDVLVQALSAGQKRRLALARLLITQSKLWILDEPFTSLDKYGIALIESLMRNYCEKGGMIVLTSHHEVDLTGIDLQRISLI